MAAPSGRGGNRAPSGPGDFVEFGSGRWSGRRPKWLGRLLLVCLVAAAVAVFAWPEIHRAAPPVPVHAPAARFPASQTLVWSPSSPWCGRRIALGCS